VKRSLFWLLTGFLGILLLSVVGVEGETIIVDVNGNGDYESIQQAVENASDGDTIRVWDGTYHESVYSWTSLSFIGNGSGLTIIDSINALEAFYIEADNVNISDFSIRNAEFGIILLGDHGVIRDNTCDNTGVAISIGENRQWNRILYNRINGDNHLISQGIFMWGSNNTVSHNEIMEKKTGILANFGSRNNTVDNNTISYCSDYGMHLLGSDSNRIIENEIVHNRIGLLCNPFEDDQNDDNQIEKNIFMDNVEYGIDADTYGSNPVDARNNWWGHTSGPYHSANNSDGQGDNVSESGQFDPWGIDDPDGPRTLYVDDNGSPDGNGTQGNPFNTINNALNESRDGDTIFVRTGTYEEDLIIETSIDIMGYSMSAVTIMGGSKESVEIQAENVTFSDIKLSRTSLRILANNVLVHNVSIWYNGISISQSNNVTIHDSEITRQWGGIGISSSSNVTLRRNLVEDKDHGGISLYQSTNCLLEGNTIDTVGSRGILLSQCSQIRITNSTISYTSSWDISIDYSDNCTVLNNTMSFSSDNGFLLRESENLTIIQSTFQSAGVLVENSWNGLVLDETNILAGKPIFCRSYLTGGVVPEGKGQVILYRCSDLIVTGQDLLYAYIGIHAIECENLTITNNTCDYSDRAGICIEGTDSGGFKDIFVSENLCWRAGSGTGIRVEMTLTHQSISNIQIENNTFSHNDYGILIMLEHQNGGGSRGADEQGIAFFIRNNTLYSNDIDGIRIRMGGGCTDGGIIIITDNVCDSNGFRGIRIDGEYLQFHDYSFFIERNIMHSDEIWLWDMPHAFIDQNSLYGGSSSGIVLLRTGNATISGNVIEECSTGINLRNADSVIVSNNSVHHADRGLYIEDSSNLTIENNNLSGNDIGIFARYEISNSQFIQNRIYNNSDFGIDATLLEGDPLDARDNWWGDTTGPYHSLNNSEGKGDNITDDVEFEPWWDGNEQPIAHIILPNTAERIVLHGEEVTFSGQGIDDGEIVSYRWISSIDGPLLSHMNFTVSDLSNGTHTITFAVQDDLGVWSNQDSIIIIINGIPTAEIEEISPLPVYLGVELSFTGIGSDDDIILEYLWTSDRDGILGDEDVIVVSNLTKGKHTISFSVLDDHGYWSTADTAEITILSPPIAVLEQISPGIPSVGSNVFFTASSIADVSIIEYLWTSHLDGVLYQGVEPVFSTRELTAGNHTVTLSVQDANGRWSDEVSSTVEITTNTSGDPSGSSYLQLIFIVCIVIFLIGAFKHYHVESLPTFLPNQESESWDEPTLDPPSNQDAEEPVIADESNPKGEPHCPSCSSPLTFLPPLQKYYCPSCKEFTEPGGDE